MLNQTIKIWNSSKPKWAEILKNYSVKNSDGVIVPYKEFVADATENIIKSTENSKIKDRESKPYIEFLDIWSESFLKFNTLSRFQRALLNTILSEYTNKVVKWKVNFSKRRNSWNGGNNIFFEELKTALDNTEFEWVTQTDLAELLGTEQNEINRTFKTLCNKWILIESWKDWKKKLFKIADIDLVWIYVIKNS